MGFEVAEEGGDEAGYFADFWVIAAGSGFFSSLSSSSCYSSSFFRVRVLIGSSFDDFDIAVVSSVPSLPLVNPSRY